MKTKILIGIFALYYGTIVYSQDFRKINNKAFKPGERIKYRAFYDAVLTGEVNAGIAELEIKKDPVVIQGRKTWHVVGIGKSIGAFNFFFRVVDRYETYLDEQAILPWIFIRRVDEGGYIIKHDVIFDRYRNKVFFEDKKTGRKNELDVPADVHDIISAFYYARTIDFSNAKEGDEFSVPFVLDDTLYQSKIHYLGKERITIPLGTFNCIKFKPMMLIGSVFKEPYPMVIWISDDENKIPIKAQSGILVGTVKMELIEYENLANPLKSKVK